MTLYTDRKPREAVTIDVDPNGSWRKNRFEFCNALEDAANRPNDRQPWSLLESMGVRRSKAVTVPAGKAIMFADLDTAGNFGTAIHAEEDANGEPRSSVVPGERK